MAVDVDPKICNYYLKNSGRKDFNIPNSEGAVDVDVEPIKISFKLSNSLMCIITYQTTMELLLLLKIL